MKKIPTLFQRDWDSDPKHVTREPNPECAWVFAGEGVATRKYDGTCVIYDGYSWWARREVKPGMTDPPTFLECDRDDTTGKRIGWEPIDQSPFAKYLAEATTNALRDDIDARHDDVRVNWLRGTYELIGPKINGNPEGETEHRLVLHALADTFDGLPLDYDGLRTWLHGHGYEGIVWHHSDGRMAKLKARDMPRVEVAP